MSADPLMERFRQDGLLPLQAEFAWDFLAPGSPPFWELATPVGSGKTHTARAIVRARLDSGDSRVLILAPSALLEQWQQRLGDLGTDIPVLRVDRRAYLELEAAAPSGGTPWPDRAVIVMSFDLAKRADITAAFASVVWDLVVIDESHHLTGTRRQLLDALVEPGRTKRALLLTSSPKGLIDHISRRKYTPDQFLGWDGLPLFPTRNVEVRAYERDAGEQQLLRKIESLAGDLATTGTAGVLQAGLLLRAASSSFLAVESTLRRLEDGWRPVRNKLAHGITPRPEDLLLTQRLLDHLIDESDPAEFTGESGDGHTALMELLPRLSDLIRGLEPPERDGKLIALQEWVAEAYKENPSARVCVWATFVVTAQYLATALEASARVPVHVVTGALSLEAKQDAVATFREVGGILVTTDALAEGASLGFVDECINFDLPHTTESFEQRWGRFVRIGRSTEFRMILARDASESLAWEESFWRTWEKQRCQR